MVRSSSQAWFRNRVWCCALYMPRGEASNLLCCCDESLSSCQVSSQLALGL
jgi:hypothetical protein